MKANACSRSSHAMRQLTSKSDFLVEASTSMKRLRCAERLTAPVEHRAEPLTTSIGEMVRMSETLSRRFLS
jgi:hypothetical protein